MTSNPKIIDLYQQKLKISTMQLKLPNLQEKDRDRPDNLASISLFEILNFYKSAESTLFCLISINQASNPSKRNKCLLILPQNLRQLIPKQELSVRPTLKQSLNMSNSSKVKSKVVSFQTQLKQNLHLKESFLQLSGQITEISSLSLIFLDIPQPGSRILNRLKLL